MSLLKRLCLCLLALTAPAQSPRLAIAAAADLQAALGVVKEAFVKEHPGVEVTLTFGSSGTFYAQIVNGAPFDCFLSADLGYPGQLVQAGLADGATAFRYGRGHLVLWVPRNSAIPLEQLGMKALLHPAAKRVAIANPRHAPYGRAAEAALTSLGLLEAVKPRLVFGENIGQTAQFVQTGAADIGILALSLAKAPAMAGAGRTFDVPEAAYPPLDQGGVILNRARDKAAAQAFADFLQSPPGRAILQRFGFATDVR
jgi:molybdate transport system substrate-binding protein